MAVPYDSEIHILSAEISLSESATANVAQNVSATSEHILLVYFTITINKNDNSNNMPQTWYFDGIIMFNVNVRSTHIEDCCFIDLVYINIYEYLYNNLYIV